MQGSSEGSVSLVRRDEGGDGDLGRLREEERDLSDSSDVLLSVPGAESKVLESKRRHYVRLLMLGLRERSPCDEDGRSKHRPC